MNEMPSGMNAKVAKALGWETLPMGWGNNWRDIWVSGGDIKHQEKTVGEWHPWTSDNDALDAADYLLSLPQYAGYAMSVMWGTLHGPEMLQANAIIFDADIYIKADEWNVDRPTAICSAILALTSGKPYISPHRAAGGVERENYPEWDEV